MTIAGKIMIATMITVFIIFCAIVVFLYLVQKKSNSTCSKIKHFFAVYSSDDNEQIR